MDALKEKIRESEVIVEIDSKNSNLAEIVQKIRSNYDKIAQKNLKETEEWYQTKVTYIFLTLWCCPFCIVCSHDMSHWSFSSV